MVRIKLADQELFGFAALWDRSIEPGGIVAESCALITMPGNEIMRHIHNTGAHPFRMPALLAKQDREQWLTGTPSEAKAVLKQYPQDCMVSYQVSTRVNSPRNNDATLVTPVERKIARGHGQMPLIQQSIRTASPKRLMAYREVGVFLPPPSECFRPRGRH